MSDKKIITVGELIDSLSQYDRNMKVEITLGQYNKSYPVLYLAPQKTHDLPNNAGPAYANCMSGQVVRIHLRLPSDGDTYTIITKRKK